ncbi:membrane integrity-associated transporter subunit PqiC [Rheinheimera sp.]|uniref:PqiC family protein n=1 Tax=Rheinheimera sp. TaxID=1869214 RepID=UPI0027B8DF63|nr:ABC-type transport auxiliary lipoprotein family protein [Rheinheimera sp.]
MKKRQLCQQAAVAALGVLLLGCSTVVTMNYFQLPQPAISTTSPAIDAPVLVVEPVMVASYLNTNALILQTSEVQLVKTQQQQWAEALDQQLSRILLRTLAAELPGYRVTERVVPGAQRLLVQVEQFHGTEQGTVLLSGRFSLMPAQGTTLVGGQSGIMQQQFQLQMPQADDGYPALVAALGELWQRQGKDIAQLLKPDTAKIKAESEQ